VRDFSDFDGTTWTALVVGSEGADAQKGYYLVLTSEDGRERVVLDKVRWVTERMAWRTLEALSDVDLRRRLRETRGR
jgi:hypothetical protein